MSKRKHTVGSSVLITADLQQPDGDRQRAREDEQDLVFSGRPGIRSFKT
jgi:hypothetical protein